MLLHTLFSLVPKIVKSLQSIFKLKLLLKLIETHYFERTIMIFGIEIAMYDKRRKEYYMITSLKSLKNIIYHYLRFTF